MQDNYPNIDKKFTDKGWAAMRDLLDEELPTAPSKRKRRGLIFLLLFLGIGVGIAIGIVASGLYFKEKTPQQSKNTLVQPIAKEEGINENKNKNENENENENKNKNEAIAKIGNTSTEGDGSNQSNVTDKTATEKDPNLVTGAQNNGETFVTKNVKTNQIGTEQERKNLLNQGLDNSKNTPELTDKVVREIANSFKINTNTQTNQEIDEKDSESIELSTIDFLKINELDEFKITLTQPELNVDFPILEEKTEDKTNLKKGRLGITLDLQGSPNFAGIAGGFTYVKPIHEKWSVQGGVNYTYQRRRFEGEPIAILGGIGLPNPNPLSTNDEFIEGAYNSNSARADTAIFAIPQNLNTHYLNIPIWVNYHLSEKWSINGGVTSSLLLLATNNYTDGGLFNKSSDFLFDLENESTATLDEQKSVNKANLTEFDLAATLGIGFHPSPKWSITANYHHGFKNLFKYSSDKEYNRFFNLGIQYYFGK